MKLALCTLLVALAAASSEPGDVTARNPYVDGVVVATNDPKDPGPGILAGGYEKVTYETKCGELAEGAESLPCGPGSATGSEGLEEASTPIEDAVEDHPRVSKARSEYHKAKAELERSECGSACLVKRAREKRLALARARSAAHKIVLKAEQRTPETPTVRSGGLRSWNGNDHVAPRLEASPVPQDAHVGPEVDHKYQADMEGAAQQAGQAAMA